MKIFIENRAFLAPSKVTTVIKAINKQIKKDFAPAWDTGATLIYRKASSESPDKAKDAVIYLQKHIDVDDALGYHDLNDTGVPWGIVSTEIAAQIGEEWSVTLSHEALELIADPIVNVTAKGPHPTKNRAVFHWYEVCDAVQDDKYIIDGVAVSNFVLPLYFTVADEGSPTNYMNLALKSFGVRPGGYIGFYDPALGRDVTYMKDKRARERWRIKSKLGLLRRADRHSRFII